MPTRVLTEQFVIGSKTFESRPSFTGDQEIVTDAALQAGFAGTITDTNEVTAVGHNITDLDTAAVYWVASGVQKCRYGCACSVATSVITLSSGAGDALPTDVTTDVTISKEVEVNLDVDGDDIQLLGMQASQVAHVHFQEEAGTGILAVLLAADVAYSWRSDAATNPLTGDAVGKVLASCGTVNGTTLYIGALVDATA